MSKKICVVIVLVGICALSVFLLNCGSSQFRPSEELYVLTQGSDGLGNNVASFGMDLESGTLTWIDSNATTCPTLATLTNTNPCGLPVDILLDPTGNKAWVLDQGAPACPSCTPASNYPFAPAIFPYTVNSYGTLTAPGAAVKWTCVVPTGTPCNDANAYVDTAVAMVRDAAGQFLFVIDQGSSPPPGYPVPSLSNPSCPPTGTGFTNVTTPTSFAGCPSISVFAMTPGSTALKFVSQSPIAGYQSPFFLSKIPTSLSAIKFTPPGSTTAQELLFVTNNTDICTQNCVYPSPQNDNTVSLYSVSPSGILTEQPNSPYTVTAADPVSVLAVNTMPARVGAIGGLFVYVGQGAGAGEIFPFQVCWVANPNCSPQDVADNLLSPLTTCPTPSCQVAPSAAGKNPVQMLVDPTNQFLYALSEGSNQVFGFGIGTTTGELSPLQTPYQPTGSLPVSMALHPSVFNTGQFLYTSNSASSNITGFTLSTTSGVMLNPITVVSPEAPSGMAVH
ncbi:MAG TPA: hypothetical protein VEH47_07830 [Candidatus Acidoferrales bacterium]|nr:hypothetical protein [Candidatus Acidoferrales bacterium]